MKKNIFALVAFLALVLVSCNESPYMPAPGDNRFNLDSIPVVMPDTNGIEISVDEAIAICRSMTPGAETAEMYKLSGVLTKNTTTPISVPGSYKNINFNLSDNGNKTSIACYYTNNLYNRQFYRSSDVPRVGSKLTVIGALTNYNGTPEMTKGFIVRIDSMVAPPPFPGCPEPGEDEISVSKAVEIALALPSRKASAEAYNIMGVVTEILEFSVSNGNATYIISDGKSYFEIYRGAGLNGAKLTSEEQIQPNDTVTINAKVQNYSGLPETSGTCKILRSTNPEL
ncbi:MAG: hypothetical protein II901_02240 [Paludibacteraceae bacterium]|nr:hypothetical protein [Paludibacteraceae bacterium]